MKKYIILLAAAVMAFAACQKREFVDQPQQGEVKMATLTCSLPADTKATLDGTGKVAWSENDSIVVWNYINGTKGESSEKIYKLVSGAGTATGVFEGEAFDAGVARVAMYPVLYKSSVFQKSAANRVYYHVPATIEMTSADDNQVTNALLFAYIPDQTKPFFFEHGGSIVRLQFKDIPASARKIKIYQPEAEAADQATYRAAAICGTRYFTATNLKGAGTTERLTNTANNSSQASHVNFSLAFPGGKEGPGLVSGKGVFYFPIPVSSAVKTRKFKVAFLDKNDIQIEGTQREFTTDTLKAGVMLTKPEIAAWIIPEDKGKGTEAEPYLIYTKEDLCKMNTQVVADTVTYFKMMDDVDMTGVTDWAPANQVSPFNVGINFNGNGHTISNFTFNQKSVYAGFIGVLNGKVANVTFKNASVTGTKAAGVVAGYAGTGAYKGDIENVNVVNGTVTQNGAAMAGLLFGTNGLAGTYTNCHTSGTVTLKDNTGIKTTNSSIGGIAGSSYASTYECCSFVGKLIGCRNSGGIVGYERVAGSIFKECWVDVIMTMSKMNSINSDNNGGIVGYCKGGTITNCYSKGSISQGQGTCGGIVAEMETFCTVKNCWSSATITAIRVAGGIVGRSCNLGWLTDSDKCLEISGCIYWGTKIDVANATDGNGSSGSIVGYNTLKNVVADCWRINDSKFTFVTGNAQNFPADQPNGCSGWVKGETPQVGTGVAPQQYLFPYWGKAVENADATISSVVTDKALAWDTTIWDLSKDYPTLKNNPE